MGLDMYLNATKWICNTNKKNLKTTKENLIKGFNIPNHIDLETLNIEIEVGYWRKANQIHNWMVKNNQHNVDDCTPYIISLDKLKKLLNLIDEILKENTNKFALSKLPPSEGFCFGSTEIDDHYWKQLKRTKTILENIIKMDNEWEFQYISSW